MNRYVDKERAVIINASFEGHTLLPKSAYYDHAWFPITGEAQCDNLVDIP
jgi:hypothetical protein